MTTQPPPQGYQHNGEWFVVRYDTANHRAIITYPAYPHATGWVMIPERAMQSGPYMGHVRYGDGINDTRVKHGYTQLTDAADWVCDQLLDLYASRAERTPIDVDATAQAIRNWISSLPALSDPEDDG